MNERLAVKNFGPVKDIDLALRQAMVFTGPHLSGKSTVARLISVFKNWNLVWDIEANSLDQFSLFQDYELFELISADTYLYFDTATHSITYQHGNFELHKKEYFSQKVDRERQKQHQRYEQWANTAQQEAPPKGRPLDKLHKMSIEEVIAHTYQTIYIPVQRTLLPVIDPEHKHQLPKYLQRFDEALEADKKHVPLLQHPWLGAEYRHEYYLDRIYLSEKQYIPLIKSSSALQSLVPLLLRVEAHYAHPHYAENLFVVEEPELHLHSPALHSLIHYLIQCCLYTEENSDKRNALLMTTHHPYVLLVLNTMLAAYRAAAAYPEQAADIAAVVPKASWLSPDKLNVYHFENGRASKIYDEASGKIDEHLWKEEIEGTVAQLQNIAAQTS